MTLEDVLQQVDLDPLQRGRIYELVMQTSGVGEFQPVVSATVDHDARKVYLRD
jgi:hypothetical protein